MKAYPSSRDASFASRTRELTAGSPRSRKTLCPFHWDFGTWMCQRFPTHPPTISQRSARATLARAKIEMAVIRARRIGDGSVRSNVI